MKKTAFGRGRIIIQSLSVCASLLSRSKTVKHIKLKSTLIPQLLANIMSIWNAGSRLNSRNPGPIYGNLIMLVAFGKSSGHITIILVGSGLISNIVLSRLRVAPSEKFKSIKCTP